MESDKVNHAGFIPDLRKVNYKGEICYFRQCKPKDFFIKYQGFGISKSVLARLDKSMRYIIQYLGKKNRYYIIDVSDIHEIETEYVNVGIDKQIIIPVKKMREII